MVDKMDKVFTRQLL